MKKLIIIALLALTASCNKADDTPSITPITSTCTEQVRYVDVIQKTLRLGSLKIVRKFSGDTGFKELKELEPNTKLKSFDDFFSNTPDANGYEYTLLSRSFTQCSQQCDPYQEIINNDNLNAQIAFSTVKVILTEKFGGLVSSPIEGYTLIHSNRTGKLSRNSNWSRPKVSGIPFSRMSWTTDNSAQYRRGVSIVFFESDWNLYYVLSSGGSYAAPKRLDICEIENLPLSYSARIETGSISDGQGTRATGAIFTVNITK